MKKRLILSGVWMMNALFADPQCWVVGHRGASGHAPENTLLAFEKAIEMGVDAIELDVYRCKSGELVVIHDATIDRTTDGKGFVKDLTLEEISQRRTSCDQIVPTLRQVFEGINRRCKIDVELKGPETASPVAELIEEYVQERGWTYDDFVATSFDHHELMKFHRLVPKVRIGALLEGLPWTYAKFAEDIGADFAVVDKSWVQDSFVQDAHRRGIRVFVYTVNDKEEIQQMLKFGVDGIISNYPERCKDILTNGR